MHEVVIADNTKDLCTLTEGVEVMRLVEAAEMASAKGCGFHYETNLHNLRTGWLERCQE